MRKRRRLCWGRRTGTGTVTDGIWSPRPPRRRRASCRVSRALSNWVLWNSGISNIAFGLLAQYSMCITQLLRTQFERYLSFHLDTAGWLSDSVLWLSDATWLPGAGVWLSDAKWWVFYEVVWLFDATGWLSDITEQLSGMWVWLWIKCYRWYRQRT